MAENKRHFDYCMILYDEHLQAVCDYLNRYSKAGVIKHYAIIQHEPDTETGQKHWHAMWKYYNAKTVTAVQKKMNANNGVIRDGLIQICNDYRMYARYLLHLDELDSKKRYPATAVNSNDIEYYRELINAPNDNQVTNEKLLLKKAYQLIDNETELKLCDILKLLSLDENIKASDVRKYSYMLKLYYNSRRFGDNI